MASNVRSGLLGGLISAVIWMIIATLVGMDKLPVVLGGLLCLIGTWLITLAVSTALSKSRRTTV